MVGVGLEGDIHTEFGLGDGSEPGCEGSLGTRGAVERPVEACDLVRVREW